MSKAEALKSIPAHRDGSPWTPTEDILVMRRDLTLVEMCFMLSRSYGAVKSRRQQLGFMKKLSQSDGVEKSWAVADFSSLNPGEQYIIRSVKGQIGRGSSPRQAVAQILSKLGNYDDELARQIVLTALTIQVKRAADLQRKSQQRKCPNDFLLLPRDTHEAKRRQLVEIQARIRRINGHKVKSPKQISALERLTDACDNLQIDLRSEEMAS